MAAPLLACSECSRHVRADESRCPFCSASLPEAVSERPVPAMPGPGRSRFHAFRAMSAGLGAGVLASSALLGPACHSESTPIPPYGAVCVDDDCGVAVEDGVDSPGDDGAGDGPGDGPLFDAGDQGHCAGEVAVPIPAADCGSCASRPHSKATAYLLCDGLFYSTCSCDLPPGYTVVEAGTKDSGVMDADAGDGGDETGG
jgi:hypothetical protein